MTARTGRSAPATRPQSGAAQESHWSLPVLGIQEASGPPEPQWSPTTNRALAAARALRESEAPRRVPFAPQRRRTKSTQTVHDDPVHDDHSP
eukprot:scaffold87494_cov66-Phaeocystis_antarctica.AAC.2